MKKRVLAVMLAAAMVFSTAACGSGTEDSGEKGSQGESSGEEETEIQVFIAASLNTVMTELAENIMRIIQMLKSHLTLTVQEHF